MKTFGRIAIAAAGLAAIAGSALAEYPEKPVTMIIPLGAGGSHDLNARVISSVLPSYLGQPVIVKLTPGAGGQTGTAAAAKSAADGYTLLFTQNFIDQLQQHVAKLPYDPMGDFVAIARTNYAAPSMVVKSDSPHKDFASLVAAAKADPGKMTFGHSGNWGAFMVPGAMLLQASGAQMTLVPHKGGGPALQALLAGQVDVSMAFNSVIDAQGDALRPLASVATSPVLDGVPTVGDLGHGDVAAVGVMHRVVLAPAGVPDAVVTKLRSAFAEMSKDKSYTKLLKKLGENNAFMDGGAYQKVREAQSRQYRDLVADLTGG